MSGGRGKLPLPRVCSRSSDAGITGCEVWSIEYVSCMQCIVCRVFQKTLLASLSCSEPGMARSVKIGWGGLDSCWSPAFVSGLP